MSISIKEVLRELTALHGVSGHEEQVARYIYQFARKRTKDIKIDRLGNITVHIPSDQESAPRVVIFGHMDEIGMIVRTIEPDGFLRMERIGGIHEHVLPGTRMTICTEEGKYITGVFGIRPHHTTPPEQKKLLPAIDQLYLDIGAESREQVLSWGVNIGNIATYPADWIEYGNDRISCKSIDNRVACTILLALLDRAAEHWSGPELYLVFGVQEEFNVRGVLPTIRRIDPDICIGLDITVVYDTPDSQGRGEVRLGAGPTVTYLHYNEGGTLAGLIFNKKLNAHFQKVAAQLNIPIQREVVIGVITETAFMSFEGTKGYICGNMSIPTRYTHTPVEMISLKDVSGAIEILSQAVAQIRAAEEFCPQPNWE